jgi:hypothetical protein
MADQTGMISSDGETTPEARVWKVEPSAEAVRRRQDAQSLHSEP